MNKVNGTVLHASLGVIIGILITITFQIASISHKLDRPQSAEVIEQPTAHADVSPALHYRLAVVHGCATRACWKRVRAARAWRRCVVSYGRRHCTFRNRFNRLPESWRRYAVAVFGCEGGRMTWANWDADGSGFYFRGEWVMRTARKAGLVRDGHRPTYHEEAIAVVRWTQRVGVHVRAGWPHCP